ncbi:hypothetical protein ACLOJK_025212 [Asimina triloba]
MQEDLIDPYAPTTSVPMNQKTNKKDTQWPRIVYGNDCFSSFPNTQNEDEKSRHGVATSSKPLSDIEKTTLAKTLMVDPPKPNDQGKMWFISLALSLIIDFKQLTNLSKAWFNN